jgi:formimidoylglutamate deiminase
MTTSIIEADLTWTGERFERGVQVRVDGDTIVEMGTFGEADTLLPDRALLPGLVNVHSHAFQRGLRGHGESFPEGVGSFWTWREAMYGLVGMLDPESFFALTLQAFREMRSAGITTVGEFHYVHHAGHHPDYAFDSIVQEAAGEAGIRLVLLNVFYATGGINKPLNEAQRRFRSESSDAYWRQMDRLAGSGHLGAAVHSIRAATMGDLSAIAAEARRRELPFHIHMEHERVEIEDSRAAYGLEPMEVLLDTIDIDGGVTAIHCTHSAPENLQRFTGNICICPLTEANLGGGIPDYGGPACLGTESNMRISMLEEMRWLEYGQRLRRERRGVLRDERGQVGRALLTAATENGARALGLKSGRIAPGHLADFTLIDLDHVSVAGWTDATLVDALAFGADNGAIAGTCVGGQWSA